MPTINLGRVQPIFRGAYDELSAYEMLDFVTHNGSTYGAKQNVPAGNAPPDANYWQLMAQGATPIEILNALKSVDGEGSGLDADLFRGLEPSDFIPAILQPALLDRPNHTGQQPISSVEGLDAALAAAASSTGSVLNKADPRTPVFIKTAAQSISIKAGTTVRTATALVTFDVATPVTMPTLSSGENYGVWVLPDGTAEALQAPAGAYDWGAHSNPDAVMIGGFHYGLVAPGTTPASGGFSTSGFAGDGGSMVWTQADVDRIAGINEYSLWDLQFRPKTFGLKGFAFDPEARIWGAIYFTGTNHIVDGLSKAGSNIASGTALPRIPLAYGGNSSNNYSRLSWYEANEIVQSHGCRLLEYQEFSSGAFGVTEAQSLGGASATPALTVRQPGYTSRLGWEQATGHVWSWGFNAHGAGGSAWETGPNRGQSYGTPYAARFGGLRTYAGNSGSRCAPWSASAWYSGWDTCVRAACDHLEPV